MIVLQYNMNKMDLNEVQSFYNLVTKKYPQEDIVALPDGISLLELDDDALGSMMKNLVNYAKLRGIDF